MNAPIREEIVAHPLFPIGEEDDDDEIRTVTSIHIARKENGKLMFAPRTRRAEELESLEQIHAEFGGGEYVLIGYNNGRISARRTVNLSGRSKPMFDEGGEPAPVVETKQAAPSQVLNPMEAMMGPQGGIMGLVMMMMQQMMQQQAQAAQSQTQMFLAMMQNTKDQSSEEKATARAELQANIERERIASERTMALMREMMQSRGGGNGEDFHKGVEFMRGFATMQIEQAKTAAGTNGESELEKILETVMQGVQGWMALKEMSTPNGAAAVASAVTGTP